MKISRGRKEVKKKKFGLIWQAVKSEEAYHGWTLLNCFSLELGAIQIIRDTLVEGVQKSVT